MGLGHLLQGALMPRYDDKQRNLDSADARRLRQEALEGRKAAAFRVLDAGGAMEDAARAGRADTRTVRRWLEERKAKP